MENLQKNNEKYKKLPKHDIFDYNCSYLFFIIICIAFTSFYIFNLINAF